MRHSFGLVGKVLGLLIVFVMALTSSRAHAQTRLYPKFFVVTDGNPANLTQPIVPGNALRRMVWIFLSPGTTGAQAANRAAGEIRAEIAAGRLAPEDVAITFNGIARDYADIDTKCFDVLRGSRTSRRSRSCCPFSLAPDTFSVCH